MALKNRHLVFAKNCTNAHGSFAKGDTARGAFSDQLVADYVAAGILVEGKAPDVALTHEGDIANGPTDTPAPLAKVNRKR